MDYRGHLRNFRALADAGLSYLRGKSFFEVEDEDYTFEHSSIVSAWEAEYFFANESEFYQDAIQEIEKGDVFYDVGANIGCFTCIMAGNGANVYSFEPDSQALRELNRNLELNSLSAEVYNYALSDSSESKPFMAKKGPDGKQRIDTKSETCVEAKRADELDIEPPDIVKIDTEGHELRVLKGMSNLIQEKTPLLYVEAHGSKGFSEVQEYLEAINYETELMTRRVDGSYMLKGEENK